MYLYQEQEDKQELRFEKYDDYLFHTIPHVHKQIEFVYVLDGLLKVSVDGRSSAAGQGECIMILPHQIHFYEADCRVSSVVVNFSGELVPTFLTELGESVTDRSVFLPDELSDLLIRRLLMESPIQTIYEQKSVLYAICNAFLKSVRLIAKEFPDNAPAYRVIHYVAAHYKEDISLKEIAQQLGYEYHYLSRIFHQTTKSGFRDFVNCHRIEYARSVIRNSDIPLSHVALDAGFQNMRSFDRTFLKVTGMTPQEFRRKREG